MKKIFGILIALLIWQIGSTMTTELFVPTPLATFNAAIGLAEANQLWPGLIYSFSRISVATMLSVLVAVPLALLIAMFKQLKEIVTPVVSSMRYIPVTAFSPLLILWFGIDEIMKVSFLFLATFVYVLPSTVMCLEDVPDDLIDTGKTIGMKAHEIVSEILLPAALPSIMNSVLMMYGIGWTYVAVVVKLHGEGAVRRRIMDMGITKRTSVYVRKVAPLGDPIEVTVRNYELSIRKADAEMIEVEETPEE